MPTNSSPGGRWLTGGLTMPPPIIGPRPPWAKIRAGAATSNISKAAAAIQLAKLLLQRTVFPLPATRPDRLVRIVGSYQGIALAIPQFLRKKMPLWGLLLLLLRFHTFLFGCPACRRGDSARFASRDDRQPALNQQLHGALDRNVRHARLFIDPSVTVELALLPNQVFAQIDALDDFKHGRAIVLERFIHVHLRDHTRHRTLGSDQRTGGGHLRPLVVIEKRVHANDDEINDDANDREADHEGEDPTRPQVFVFELGFVAGVARIRVTTVHHFVAHISLLIIRYSCDCSRSLSVCGALTGSSGRDLRLWKK